MRLLRFAMPASLFVSMLAVPGVASATPVFTFSFNPISVTASPGQTVEIDATVTNIGTTDITRATGINYYYGNIDPYVTVNYLGSPTETIYQEFTGVDIAPTQSFNFVYESFTLASDTPGGTYSVFQYLTGASSPTLSLGDVNGGTGFLQPTNTVSLTVAPTPEPSGLILFCTGLLGIGGFALSRRGLKV